ncbi:hypothetical protein NBRC116583_28140 [Arenicella sp. 4NH20-0111]
MELNICSVGGYWDVQKRMAMGVKNAASTLDVAVKDTDSAAFPLDNSTKMFETLPPGQQDINSIPNAIEGCGSNRKQRLNVSKGNARICPKNPAIKSRGAVLMNPKSLTFRPNATASIIQNSVADIAS